MDNRLLNDNELVQKCQHELPELTSSFNELVRRYKDYVFTLSFNKLANKEDAEDATQETFIRIFYGIKSFRMESKLKTWITVIAGNVCLTMVLSQKRKFWKFQVSLDGDADLEGIYSMLLSQQQEYDFWKKMGRILRSMFSNYRKVFIFRYFKNFTIQIIAEKIHITLGAAKMRLKRAKNQFINIFLRN